ncbi:ABC transporter permease subunit [Streptomyces sp. TS71-3]|uniref:ABC transporter permease subunit n=1 Tax=Streptomyces sp. TS71-3 TaxID=2733862 RepID=UPI001B2EE366|nr:ABC transporter permease subunit [Streptomyces sp. TS71-3]GHJ38680.1 ABC transporter [Streptomyces sp. TS71-3]
MADERHGGGRAAQAAVQPGGGPAAQAAVVLPGGALLPRRLRSADRETARLALHAEWTKLRTVPAPAWLPASMVVLTVALGAATSATAGCPAPKAGGDPVRTALSGVMLGQAAAAVLAVLVIGDEYGTGMIRTTLTAVPRRTVALAAKAGVVAGAVLAAGVLAVLGSLLACLLVLPALGVGGVQGCPALPPSGGPMLRAAAGSVLYLVLVALLALGVATAVRDSAAAVGAVLALLYLFPLLATVVADPDWHRRLERAGPMTAGLAVQVTVHQDRVVIGPWAGLGVLAAWSAAALLAGGLLLRARDV